MNKTRLLCLAPMVLFTLTTLAAQADDVLWNLTFSDLKPGQPLAEVPYKAPCTGPQKVTTDAQNTLVGGSPVDTLTTPLLYTKGSTTHYTPAFTLKADNAITTGVITVSMDILFDKITPTPDHPVETLMAFPFINGDGGTTFILVIACSGPTNLVLGGAGLKKGTTPANFTAGKVAHIKAVLDLNKHTFQAFLDDVAMAGPEQDDTKFNTFLGFTARDGTALGGNNGATFNASIGNLVISHS